MDVHHETHLERPVLSVRDSYKSQAALNVPTGFDLRLVLSVWCLTLTAMKQTAHRTRKHCVRCLRANVR